MARTIDSILSASQAARALRRADRNPWMYKVRIPLDTSWSFAKMRDEFASGLLRSTWFRAVDREPGDELWDLWDEIKDAETVEHFNAVLDQIYDLADEERCWLTLR